MVEVKKKTAKSKKSKSRAPKLTVMLPTAGVLTDADASRVFQGVKRFVGSRVRSRTPWLKAMAQALVSFTEAKVVAGVDTKDADTWLSVAQGVVGLLDQVRETRSRAWLLTLRWAYTVCLPAFESKADPSYNPYYTDKSLYTALPKDVLGELDTAGEYGLLDPMTGEYGWVTRGAKLRGDSRWSAFASAGIGSAFDSDGLFSPSDAGYDGFYGFATEKSKEVFAQRESSSRPGEAFVVGHLRDKELAKDSAELVHKSAHIHVAGRSASELSLFQLLEAYQSPLDDWLYWANWLGESDEALGATLPRWKALGRQVEGQLKNFQPAKNWKNTLEYLTHRSKSALADDKTLYSVADPQGYTKTGRLSYSEATGLKDEFTKSGAISDAPASPDELRFKPELIADVKSLVRYYGGELSKSSATKIRNRIVLAIHAGDLDHRDWQALLDLVLDKDVYFDLLTRKNGEFMKSMDILIGDWIRTKTASLNRDLTSVLVYASQGGAGKTEVAKYTARVLDLGHDPLTGGARQGDPFDGYEGERCVIFDDYKPDTFGLGEFYAVFDPHTRHEIGSRYKNINPYNLAYSFFTKTAEHGFGEILDGFLLGSADSDAKSYATAIGPDDKALKAPVYVSDVRRCRYLALRTELTQLLRRLPVLVEVDRQSSALTLTVSVLGWDPASTALVWGYFHLKHGGEKRFDLESFGDLTEDDRRAIGSWVATTIKKSLEKRDEVFKSGTKNFLFPAGSLGDFTQTQLDLSSSELHSQDYPGAIVAGLTPSEWVPSPFCDEDANREERKRLLTLLQGLE